MTAAAHYDQATDRVALLLDVEEADLLLCELDASGAISDPGLSAVRQVLAQAVLAAEDTVVIAVPPEKSDQVLTVAIDGGAAPSNPGPTGWAWVDSDFNCEAGFIELSTNNVGELTALEQVLLAHPDQSLHIVYDSQYAVNCVTQWGPAWMRAGKTSKANQEQIYRIIEILARRDAAGLVTEFEWVKGHSGHELNEAADTMVARVREMAKGSPGELVSVTGYAPDLIAGRQS